MIYTPYTLEAMRLSYAAHHGQLDRAGAPYIFHLFPGLVPRGVRPLPVGGGGEHLLLLLSV